MSLSDRVAKFIDATGPCWLWLGVTENGYGRVWADGHTPWAHRYVYEQLVGPIPKGMVLDHLCRVRHCVNPDHLEITTRGANVMRSPITIPRIRARERKERLHAME